MTAVRANSSSRRDKYARDSMENAVPGNRASPLVDRTQHILLVPIVLAGLVINWQWLVTLYDWATIEFLRTNDWSVLAGLDPRNPYATEGFHWSVPAAWIWAGLVVPMGFFAWAGLHFLAIATIRDWRVVVLVFATFPFWADVASGNMLTFAFVAAWHALAGNRAGVVAFVVLAALIPRPLMVPVLAYLLWTRKDARWAFAAAAGVVVASGLATGTLWTWIGMSLGTATGGWMEAHWNVGPSSVLGTAWLPLGLVLGAWAWWRGRLGLASLLVSPYLIHYYAIFALLELAGSRHLHVSQKAIAARDELIQRLSERGRRHHVGVALDRFDGVAPRV